ncbi:hypothetical protein SSX86_005887 [Deinandra increscens subsp. villosa]|uniref:Uncharacterized protein n=1 Tax=Deinandra increscens subsp. villosa TaxID=3103831 RepID=A0AAP0HCB7_9ASTR
MSSLNKPNHPTNIPSVPSKIGADQTPIKIGAKGTIGSLMMKEIEYFNRLEVHSKKHALQPPKAAADHHGGRIKPKIDSVMTTVLPRRKKRSSRFISSICSAIDVAADNKGPKLVSGFGYRTLKADVRRLQV